MGKPGAISNNLSFGITITVSVTFLNFSRPFSAFLCLLKPSTVKGNVTTATVRAPIFLAISAITGAEPVPVPPPNPQVTKTMSLPSRTSFIVLSSSLADSSPTLGSLPAPNPRVTSFPIKIFLSALVSNKS